MSQGSQDAYGGRPEQCAFLYDGLPGRYVLTFKPDVQALEGRLIYAYFTCGLVGRLVVGLVSVFKTDDGVRTYRVK